MGLILLLLPDGKKCVRKKASIGNRKTFKSNAIRNKDHKGLV